MSEPTTQQQHLRHLVRYALSLHRLHCGSSVKGLDQAQGIDQPRLPPTSGSSNWVRPDLWARTCDVPNLTPVAHRRLGAYSWRGFRSWREVDTSSVRRRFEVETQPSSAGGPPLSDEAVCASLARHDYVARMPPIRELTVRVRVASVGKGTPRPVGPEGF